MYEISILCSDLKRGFAVADAFKVHTLYADVVRLSPKMRKIKGEAYVIVTNCLSSLKLLPDFIFNFPCILLFEDEKILDSNKISHGLKIDFDRIFYFPFVFSNICMQLKYLIFSHQSSNFSQQLIASDLVVDLDTREVLSSDQQLQLSHREFGLLEFLMRNANKALTRNEILEKVWDRNSNLFTNTVDVHIGRLRRKLDSSMPGRFIKTIHGFGYMFVNNSDPRRN